MRRFVVVVSLVGELGASRGVFATQLAYVANAGANSISAIDTETNAVVATLSPGVGLGGHVLGIAPDGARVYATNRDAGTVSIIDAGTHTVISSFAVSGTGNFAFSPDGRVGYVASDDMISVFDTASGNVIGSVGVGGAIAITPDGSRLYIAGRSPNGISAVDTANRGVVDFIPFGGVTPSVMAMTADGTRAYVAAGEPATIIALDTATDAVTSGPPIGGADVQALAVSPDGRVLYLGAGFPSNNYILAIDALTMQRVGTISLGRYSSRIGGIVFAPDGVSAYVALYDAVAVVDTATRKLVGAIDIPALGSVITGIAITPDGKQVYADGCQYGVCVISTASNAITATIPGFFNLRRLAIGPDGFAYLTGEGSHVGVIDLGTNRLSAAVLTYNTDGVAVTPDGSHVYVTSGYRSGQQFLSPIDTPTNSVEATLTLGYSSVDESGGVAVAPNGSFAYITNSYAKSVVAVSTATNDVVATIPIDGAPLDVAFAPDGTRAYVVGTIDAGVAAIDPATHHVTDALRFPSHRFDGAVAINGAGTFAYALRGKTIDVIDLSTVATVAQIPLERVATDITLARGDTVAYVLHRGNQYDFSGWITVVDLIAQTVTDTIQLYGRTPNRLATTPDGTRVFVSLGPEFECNIGGLSIIDVATGAERSGISNVGNNPQAMAFTPDGRLVYVTDPDTGQIVVVDTETSAKTASIPFSGILGMAATPDGRFVYVSAFDYQTNGTVIQVISTATQSVVGSIPVNGLSGPIVMRSNTGVAYAGVAGGVALIDTATHTLGSTVPLAPGAFPARLALTADGLRLFAVSFGSTTFSVMDTVTNNVSALAFSPATFGRLALTPDGSSVYTTSSNGPNAAGVVAVFSVAARELVKVVPVGIDPRGVAITTDGTQAYVANAGSDTVSVLDTASNKVVATVPVGHQPVAVAIGSPPDRTRTPSATASATPTVEPLPLPDTPTPTVRRTASPTPVPVTSTCGNGTVDGDETCDDGNSVGGDGCAANCTVELRRAFVFDHGSALTLQLSNAQLTPFVMVGREILTTGSARASQGSGEIPVVVKANDFQVAPIQIPGLGCFCVRATVVDAFGPGNAGQGVIGCGGDGLQGVNALFSVDHNIGDGDADCATGVREGLNGPHPGVCNGIPAVTFSGDGAQGAARITTALAITYNEGSTCDVGDGDPAKGPDGIPCTADDLVQGPTDSFAMTTGTAMAEVFDADNQPSQVIGPGAQCGTGPCNAEGSGMRFDCGALATDANGGTSGAVLAGAVGRVDRRFDASTAADNVFTIRLVAAAPDAHPTPTPPIVRSVCGNTCDGRSCGVVSCPGGHAVSAARCVGVASDGCECIAVECMSPTPTRTVTPTAPPPPLPSAACGPALPRYAGSLCGPPQNPCVVLRDEAVAAYGFGPIAVVAAGQPRIFFTTSLGNFVGHYATRSAAGTWTSEDVAIGVATAGFVVDPDGTPYVLATDSAAGSALWSRDDRGWRVVERVEGAVLVGGEHGFARDDAGCFHAGAELLNGAAYARRHDTWGYALVGTPDATVAEAPVLALAPSGRPHLVFWEATAESGWVIRWAAPPLAAETIPPTGATGQNGLGIALAVTAAPNDVDGFGIPHLLFNRYFTSEAGGQGVELAYAVRHADGTWSVRSVARGSPDQFAFAQACGVASHFGETCSYTYDTYVPVAVVASGNGEVRLLYARQTAQVDATSQCFGCVCQWQWQSLRTVGGSLEVAWPDGEQVGHATLVDGIVTYGGTAVIDDGGRIQLAVGDNGALRYLMIGNAAVPTPTPSDTPTEKPRPTPTPTAPAAATTVPGHSGGGCSIAHSGGTGRGLGCWVGVLPLVPLRRRRRGRAAPPAPLDASATAARLEAVGDPCRHA